MRVSISTVALLVGATITACGGTDTAPVTRSLQIVSGSSQTGAAGAALTLPVVFAVLDGATPVSGAVVTFHVLDGGGRVVSETDVTDVTGHARAFWTLGKTAGSPQTLEATASAIVGSTVVPHTVANATVVAGPGTILRPSVAATSARVGESFPQRVTVALEDSVGNRVANAGTVISARAQEAGRVTILSGSTATTDATGTASFDNLALSGRPGALNLQFESPGFATASVALILGVGAPARVTAVGGSVVRAVVSATAPAVAARVADVADNGVPGIDVIFGTQELGGLGRASTDSTGIATLTGWRVPGSGTYTLVAAAAGVSAPATQTLIAGAGPAATVQLLSAPSSKVVATRASVQIISRDAGGNIPQPATVSYSMNEVSGTVPLDVDGRATFAMTLPTVAGPSQLVFSSNGATIATFPVTLVAGPFAWIALTSVPSTVAAGSPITFVAHGLDAYGNATPGIAINANMGDWVNDRPAPLNVTTDAGGNAPFSFPTSAYAGERNIDVYAYATSIVVRSFTVFASAARGTLYLQDSFPCAGGFQIETGVTARLFAPSGHTAVGVPVTFSVAPGNGSLYGLVGGTQSGSPQTTVVAVTDALGFASVAWNLRMPPGTYSLSVNAGDGYVAVTPQTYTCRITS